MKKLLILLIVMCAGAGLYAQKGLFNLAYGHTVAQVDSILAGHSFYPEGSEHHAIKYYSDVNQLIDAIMVFVEPKSQRVAGWFVKYSALNGEDNDHIVIDRIMDMHGKTNHFDEDTQQLIWFLSTTRTLHVMYSSEGNLTALYYDSVFPELFQMNEEAGKAPEDIPEPIE